jgi:hypothetical protein
MTEIHTSRLFATFDRISGVAKKHAVGGVLTEADLAGLYRRAASECGCTPDDAKRWIEARRD